MLDQTETDFNCPPLITNEYIGPWWDACSGIHVVNFALRDAMPFAICAHRHIWHRKMSTSEGGTPGSISDTADVIDSTQMSTVAIRFSAPLWL